MLALAGRSARSERQLQARPRGVSVQGGRRPAAQNGGRVGWNLHAARRDSQSDQEPKHSGHKNAEHQASGWFERMRLRARVREVRGGLGSTKGSVSARRPTARGAKRRQSCLEPVIVEDLHVAVQEYVVLKMSCLAISVIHFDRVIKLSNKFSTKAAQCLVMQLYPLRIL
jgi:hypothetical protein